MRYRVAPLLLLVALLASFTQAQSAASGINAPRLFEQGMDALTGIGPERNEHEALNRLRRSAELGYPPAQTVIGYFADTGTVLPKDPVQAAEWYKKAAQQGDPLGEWLLGRLYYTGTGVPRDLGQAATWLQKAGDQDDAFGAYLLGEVKLQANDYSAAADWFRKAALKGLPQAQQQLGLLLEQGRGVTQDSVEAYLWLRLSFENANEPVASDLARLETSLGSSKVTDLKEQVRDLQQTTSRVSVARGCTAWAGEFDATPAPPPPDIQRFCR